MSKTVKYYIVMSFLIGGMLLAAFISTSGYWSREEERRVARYETLSYEQISQRYKTLDEEMTLHKPETPREYFAVIGRAYCLIGSAQKWMHNQSGPLTEADGRYASLSRDIPVTVQRWINTYSVHLGEFPDYDEVTRERVAYEATEVSPISPTQAGDYSSVVFWWFLFHFASMPLVAIHFGIQLRKRNCSIWMDVCGNPMFPVWLFLWEVGIFRYPSKVSPFQQLQRARRWAGLVLCSAMGCFAGTGKICEKPQRAQQHQKYGGLVRGFGLSTASLNDYLGLDGAVFHPGAVQQSSATAKLACGFFAGVWASEPLGQRDIRPNFGREVDLFVGWSGAVHGFNVSGGATYFAVSPLRQIPAEDLLQSDVMLSRPITASKVNVKPYLWIRNVSPIRNGIPHGGTFVHWGVGLSRPLSTRTTGNLGLELVRDPGAFGFNPGKIGRVLTDITWKTKIPGLTLQLPILRVTSPFTHTGDGRGLQVQFGLGLSFAR